MTVIYLLRIPFVRIEFINTFLKIFDFDKTEMNPEKIAQKMNKLSWKQYKLSTDIQSKTEYFLSRDTYLKLLLMALSDYCDWYGSKEYFLYDAPKYEKRKPPIQWSRSLRQPPGKFIDLDAMELDIEKLELQMNMKVQLETPRVELALVDIFIDDALLLKYRKDLKYLAILHNMIPKQIALPDAPNLSDWVEFLKEFAPPNTN